jgi:hypothetical protein
MSKFTEAKNLVYKHRDLLSLTVSDSEFFDLINRYSGIRKPSESVMNKDLQRLYGILKPGSQ